MEAALLDPRPSTVIDSPRPALPGFGPLLVATDFSAHGERAVARAALLAREHGTALTLMHVIAPTRELFAPAALDTGLRVSQARVMLARTARRVRRTHGIDVATRLHEGPVRAQILARAARSGLLAIGHGGGHPLAEWLLGSQADRLLNRLCRPMLVVKGEPRQRYRRVVVPVDLSGLGSAALRATARLLPEAAIDLVHVLGHGNAGWMRRADIDPAVIATYRARDAQRAEDELQRIAAAAGHPRAQIRASLRHGDTLRAVLERERDANAELVVLVHDEPSPWRDFLLGSLTRRLIAAVRSDVLVLPRAALHPFTAAAEAGPTRLARA